MVAVGVGKKLLLLIFASISGAFCVSHIFWLVVVSAGVLFLLCQQQRPMMRRRAEEDDCRPAEEPMA